MSIFLQILYPKLIERLSVYVLGPLHDIKIEKDMEGESGFFNPRKYPPYEYYMSRAEILPDVNVAQAKYWFCKARHTKLQISPDMK